MKKCSLLKLSLVLLPLLVGCSTTKEVNNTSEAYNIANQTILTKDYRILLTKYKCPLKDYSADDVKAIQAAFEKRSPGNLSIAFGVLSLLGGDLMSGGIDIVGGTTSNIASSRHRSSNPTWFAAIPKKQAKNGLDATNQVRKTIQNEAINLLEEYGVELEKVVIKSERKAVFGGEISREVAYKVKNSDVVYGFHFNEFYLSNERVEMVEGRTNFIADKEQFVLGPETQFYGLNIFNKEFFIKNKIAPFDEKDGYDVFMNKLTSRLPQGYFYYSSPSESANFIPAIYKNGKKYLFLSKGIAL
ncbi:hypothetical protein [Photobacterium iliopiscarium]|uniref:Lipoprotein n=1 Tax=Photobacterium iliopiscarium TaxID=56192 RepID=A0A2T3MNI6_9GAMM|nr:hypothetical protein [Photobacterium iliopiscarium]PSV98316.1 hypothetical protein C9I88_06535 [Photobacterium iliopiscarium]